MGGVEAIIEQAGPLRFGEPLDLFPVVSRSTGRICRRTSLQALPLQQTAKFRVGRVIVEHGSGERTDVVQASAGECDR